jgi:putative colanic acid biosynthesis glycosyltransferase
LNAGDIFQDENVVQDLLLQLEKAPPILYSKVLCHSDQFQWVKGSPVKLNDFRFGMPISHQGLVYRKNDLLKHPYDISYRIIADLKSTKAIFKTHGTAVYFDRIVCQFDLGGVSSRQHFAMMKERMRLALEERDWLALIFVLLFEYPKYSVIWFLRQMGIYSLVNRMRYGGAKDS